MSISGPSATKRLGRDDLGYVPQTFAFYPHFTVRQLVEYVAALTVVPRSEPAIRIEAAIAARVQLRYDDDAADLVSNEEYEAIISPLNGTIDASTLHPVDFDDRDLRPEVPAGRRYPPPAVKLSSA